MSLKVRSVNLADSLLIFTWRNHFSVKKFLLNKQVTSPGEHDTWYANRLKYVDEQPFWIFSESDMHLGYVRFDHSSEFLNYYEISVCINPEYQKLGYGKIILEKSLEMILAKRPSCKIVARVHEENLPSISLFNKFKFKRLDKVGKFLILELVNSSVRFIFRADASMAIGTGHTQRPLGIIEELIRLKYKVIFIGNTSEIPWVTKKINSIGFTEVIDSEKKFLPNNKTDILILDSYTLKPSNPFLNKSNWRLVVIIQDLFTPSYAAHLTIHPGITEMIPSSGDSIFISGPNYIPLRKTISRRTNQINSKQLVITVIGGGVDRIGFAEEMSKQLKIISGNFKVNIFSNNTHLVEVDSRFTVYEMGNLLDEVGNQTDLVFCTSSSTALEFIARGCAVGICCGSDNQKQHYERLPKLGVAQPIGEFLNGQWNLDVVSIQNLISSKALREKLSAKSKDLIDLDGSLKIVQEIISNLF